MDTFWLDLRCAARTLLLRSRGFTVLIALTLGLGIGANTAVFSILRTVLLKPFPYAAPEQLVRLDAVPEGRSRDSLRISYPDYLDWREQSRSFQDMAAFQYWTANLSEVDEPERISALRVSASLFPMLGVRPARGRMFLAEEDRPGAPRVALIGHDLWQRRFGADPGLVGRTVRLDGELYTVCGVMPPDFKFPEVVEVWVPLALDPAQEGRDERFLLAVARLRTDVAQARTEMEALTRRLDERFPDTNRGVRAAVVPLREYYVGNVRPVLLVLMAAVGLVLLIACANAANLLLARAWQRSREMAIRSALGVSRSRLARQLLTEATLLSLLGGLLGVLLAAWGVRLIVASIPIDLPFWLRFELDGQALLFTLLLCLATPLLFGLVPALRASRPDLGSTLKDGSSGASAGLDRRRLRRGLVVTEIALASVLLIAATLLLRSFLRMQAVETGFSTAGVLTAQVTLPPPEYPGLAEQHAFYDAALERIRSLPGVRSASAVSNLPMRSGSRRVTTYAVEGAPPAREGDLAVATRLVVSPRYFRTLGIRLLPGGDFTERHTAESVPVAIVSQAVARRAWPAGDPIGKRLRLVGLSGDAPWLTVVGVAGDVHQFGLDGGVDPVIYLPDSQSSSPFATLVIQGSLSSGTAAAVRAAIRDTDPSLPVWNVLTLEKVVSDALWRQRIYTTLLAIFAIVGLVLGTVGVYGLMMVSVHQRHQEIAVRMAMGAARGNVLRMVLREGLSLGAFGVGFGLLGAFGATRALSRLLFGVSATDIATFVGIPALLLAAALAASLIPAWQATRVEPQTVLRAG